MDQLKLFMLLLGCKPAGRHTEQHDIFFGIGTCLSDLKQSIIDFWPEAKGDIHIDAWREINFVEGHKIEIISCTKHVVNNPKLFFINLGGYKKNEFDEFHYKLLIGAANKGEAITQGKTTSFYKHTGFKGAPSHIDDKYGIDVDDVFAIADILPGPMKEKYSLLLSPGMYNDTDEVHLGYLRIDKI